MPCGGIYLWVPAEKNERRGPCFHCNEAEPIPTHMCIEWDAYLHDVCVIPFLATAEGKVVLEHRHSVHLVFDGSTES